MEYRKLGNTDITISRLGLGGIPLQHLAKDQVQALIDATFNAGINFIDTARGYTISEEMIGYGVKSNREKWVLASKTMVRTKEGIIKELHTSLKNMQTDYLDLYQIHNVRTQAEWEAVTAPEGALAGLQKAKEEGLVRHIGITAHSAEMMAKALDSGLFATMMFPYNAVESQNKHLFETAHNNKIGTLVMKPLGGGFIADAEKALRYLAADTNADCLLVGMDSPEEVLANVQALAKGPLTKDEKEELETWTGNAGQDFCRRCGYCLPCPQGIDIPSVFLLEGYYDRYELQDWAIDRYKSMANLASACAGCGQCKEKCPYSLPIPEKLARAVQKLEPKKL